MTIASEVAGLVGITPSSCHRIANSAGKRYKVFFIPKRRMGQLRQVAQPSKEVKAVQRAIVEKLRPLLPVHDSATAYKCGSSILLNADRHKQARFITKLDFASFFPSVNAQTVAQMLRARLPEIIDSDITFILSACLWRGDGPHALCIGAPSSPLLSNAVMFDFDSKVSEFCADLGVIYTRYSDDITLSSREPNVLGEIEGQVRRVCREMTHPSLTINESKRVAVGRGAAMRVTGLTLANQGVVTVGRLRKRGVRAGLDRFLRGPASDVERARLRGEVAFVLSIEPHFRDVLIRTYGMDVMDMLPAVT